VGTPQGYDHQVVSGRRLPEDARHVHERPGTAYPELFHPPALARARRRPNTIACYRDTIRLLVSYVCQQTGKQPARQSLADLDTAMISAFLDHLETSRGNSITTRNGWLRLPALRVALNRRVAPHTVGTTGQDEL
jgi:hypothetical protein